MKNNSKFISRSKGCKTRNWESAPGLEAPLEDSRWDSQLNFTSPVHLEVLGNQFSGSEAGMNEGDFFSRAGFGHLKNTRIDLGALDLTDRQLTAVSLVFYGGIKKKRAARVMSISSQAVSDHLNAALKKIRRSLE